MINFLLNLNKFDILLARHGILLAPGKRASASVEPCIHAHLLQVTYKTQRCMHLVAKQTNKQTKVALGHCIKVMISLYDNDEFSLFHTDTYMYVLYK